MGLFDKAKAFVGGKGMATVTIPVIERQPSETATFPVKDTVLKGMMTIEAQKDCTLLACKYEIWLYIKGDVGESTGTPHLVAQAQDPDPNTSYSDDMLKFPHDMKAGETVEQPWLVTDVDLPKVLEKAGYVDPMDATGDPRVQLVVKCIADVKGSPFDPSAEVNVTLSE
jgi:hypothetical protein